MSQMSASRLFAVLTNVSSDVQCCKRLGIRFINTPFTNFNLSVQDSLCQSVHQTNVYRFYKSLAYTRHSIRFLSSARLKGTSDSSEDPITKPQANDLVLRLTEQERENLLTALQEFEANKIKTEYEGKLFRCKVFNK